MNNLSSSSEEDETPSYASPSSTNDDDEMGDDANENAELGILRMGTSIMLLEGYGNDIDDILHLDEKSFLANKKVLVQNFQQMKANMSDMLNELQTLSSLICGDDAPDIMDMAKDNADEIYECLNWKPLRGGGDGAPLSRLSPEPTLNPTNLFHSPSDLSLPSDSIMEDDMSMESMDGEETFKIINQRWKQLENGSLMVVNTTILSQIEDRIDSIFDTHKPSLSQIPSLVSDTICIFGPLTKANQALAERKRITAGNNAVVKMGAVPDYGINKSYSFLLTECDGDGSDDNDVDLEIESPEVTALLDQVKLAIYRNNTNDDTAKSCNLDKVVSDSKLQSVIKVGHPTRNISMHVLNVGMAYELISTVTMYKLYKHLGKRDELIKHAKELARRVDPTVEFNKHTTVTQYLEYFAYPGLRKDDERRAASCVICDICYNLNQLKQHDRKGYFLRRWRRIESKRVGDGGSDKLSRTYCSEDNKVHRFRRLKAIRTLQALLLKEIMRILFPGLFDRRGYTGTILRLSPSHIMENTSFVSRNFFQESASRTTIAEIAVKIEKNIVKKKLKSDEDNDTGDRTLIVEAQCQEQIDSLERLLMKT